MKINIEMELSFKEQLYQLEQRLLQPEVRKSTDDITMLLADDFFEFGSSGRVFHRQQVVEELPSAPSVRMTIQNFHAKILASDLILTTFRIVEHDETGTEKMHSLRSSIWKFIDGRWQMLFHQGTPTIVVLGHGRITFFDSEQMAKVYSVLNYYGTTLAFWKVAPPVPRVSGFNTL